MTILFTIYLYFILDLFLIYNTDIIDILWCSFCVVVLSHSFNYFINVHVCFYYFWQTALEEAQRHNLQSLFIQGIDQVSPLLVLHVSRDNIVQDTIRQLAQKGSGDLKKPLKVILGLFERLNCKSLR